MFALKEFIGRILLALLPILVGAAGVAVFQSQLRELPLLLFRADLGSALLVLCGVISIILLAWVAGWGIERQKGIAKIINIHRQQEETHRRFIRRLDHELKNPLTGLRAALANISFEHNSNIIQDAQSQVGRLSRLVSDLRKLAELEERPLETSQVNIAEVLEEGVEAICALPIYSNRVVRLVVSKVPWPLPPVAGDRDLLSLVIYNLIDNALKYSAPDGEVEIRAVEDGRRILIEVADNGPGIPNDEIPKIFEELYRGLNARGLEGSGLGLALVKRVLDRHSGEISVQSRQGEYQGTIMRVTLPIR